MLYTDLVFFLRRWLIFNGINYWKRILFPKNTWKVVTNWVNYIQIYAQVFFYCAKKVTNKIMGADPIVSVCLITYNHVSFIRDAIEGVLSQKVNFPWEFIIADDFSVDGSRDIVVEYQKKYPELIRLILQEKNVGAANNWFDLMKAPKGKYIAYFEGDDYWIDDHKLQKQVDFLEKNEKYVGCSSNVYE